MSLTDDQVVQTRPLWWTDLDTKAVDTARVLAMDAVQRAGNGHPGTAKSLAPLAYLMFQKVLRHDPSDPNWVSRDRFVLSNGHSSLTRTPGHPEHGHTIGVETTTGPLGQGVAKLPPNVRARVSVDAGVPLGWREIVGDVGEIVSINHYGASAAGSVLFEQFGFTPDRVVAAAHATLDRVGKISSTTTGT